MPGKRKILYLFFALVSQQSRTVLRKGLVLVQLRVQNGVLAEGVCAERLKCCTFARAYESSLNLVKLFDVTVLASSE
jgi:hypothetical protein